MGSSPKKPKKTAEEVALERRQSMMIDKEIEESESLLNLMAKRQLGSRALLAGSPASARAAASSRAGGSMLPSSGRFSTGTVSSGSSKRPPAQGTVPLR